LERGEGEIGEEDAGLNRRRGELETARISAGLKAEEWRQFPVRERRNGGEDDADRWVRPVSGEREREGIPIRFRPGVGHGPKSMLGRKASRGPIHIFLSLLLFPFSVFFISFITFAY
jgi:hypothetical protein